MKNVTTYRLQIMKEKTSRYDITKKISAPIDAYTTVTKIFSMEEEAEEVLVMLTLNTKNSVTGAFEISRGSLNSSIVHPREVFKRALLDNAASIIIAHNHPSGDPTPSGEDTNITHRLKECGKLMGIELLDHIIVGEGNYVSLKERGVL